VTGTGLHPLPEPSPGDIFFDIEGDPFAEDCGLEYLFGVVEIGADGSLSGGVRVGGEGTVCRA
jgi:uncharacterized protein